MVFQRTIQLKSRLGDLLLLGEAQGGCASLFAPRPETRQFRSEKSSPQRKQAGRSTDRERRATRQRSRRLLLLLVMQGVLAEPRAVLFELQLLATRLAAEDVVHVACLFAHQEDDFGFLLALGHE